MNLSKIVPLTFFLSLAICQNALTVSILLDIDSPFNILDLDTDKETNITHVLFNTNENSQVLYIRIKNGFINQITALFDNIQPDSAKIYTNPEGPQVFAACSNNTTSQLYFRQSNDDGLTWKPINSWGNYNKKVESLIYVKETGWLYLLHSQLYQGSRYISIYYKTPDSDSISGLDIISESPSKFHEYKAMIAPFYKQSKIWLYLMIIYRRQGATKFEVMYKLSGDNGKNWQETKAIDFFGISLQAEPKLVSNIDADPQRLMLVYSSLRGMMISISNPMAESWGIPVSFQKKIQKTVAQLCGTTRSPKFMTLSSELRIWNGWGTDNLTYKIIDNPFIDYKDRSADCLGESSVVAMIGKHKSNGYKCCYAELSEN